MNFLDFIAFCVMEQHNDAVFIAEFREREVERPEPLEALIVTNGVLITGESVQTLGGEEALVNSVYSAPRKTPPLVNEEVVHDTGQPRSGLVYGDEVVELSECLDQQVLEQVFSFGAATGQAKREPIQPVKVWSHQFLEGLLVGVGAHDYPESSHLKRASPERTWHIGLWAILFSLH